MFKYWPADLMLDLHHLDSSALLKFYSSPLLIGLTGGKLRLVYVIYGGFWVVFKPEVLTAGRWTEK